MLQRSNDGHEQDSLNLVMSVRMLLELSATLCTPGAGGEGGGGGERMHDAEGLEIRHQDGGLTGRDCQ